jgi:hypothetical protein
MTAAPGRTAPPTASTTPARWRFPVFLLAVFVIAAVVGAYLDWTWWEVYNGVVITLGAAALLVAAVVLLVPRRSRPVGLVLGAAAIGLIVGQNLGPSRSPLTVVEGTVALSLTSPVAAEGTAPATCTLSQDGRELSVSGDPNLRLAILASDPNAPSDVDQRAFVGAFVTVGDRWEPLARRDDLAEVSFLVGSAAAGAGETWMVSDGTSFLDLAWDPAGGSVAFDGLVPDSRHADAPVAPSDPIDLAGTMTWTCRPS